jgi:hypothetical protein
MPIAEDSAGGSPVPIPTNLTTNLTGEATGSGTLDYTTGDIDIAVTVVDNGHNHILSNITDVQVNNAISGQILVYNGTVWANATNTSGITAIVQDTSPQLGGNLDLNNRNITGTGNIAITGTIDGRDVSADGTKLDGIESGATADQTAAQIKTAYESNANTNNFADADVSKLSGIEPGATADQTAAQIKTAYESNADTNAFTDADHTKLDGIETAADVTDTTNVVASLTAGTNVTIAADGTISATGGTSGIAHVVDDTTPQLGGNLDLNSNDITGTGNLNFTGSVTLSGTVDGRDVAADGTKLDGIEASADVTDTANVTAAGALMDSEVTNLAQVKAFDSSDYATSAQGTTADAALPKAGGTMTGKLTLESSDPEIFLVDTNTNVTTSIDANSSAGSQNNVLVAKSTGIDVTGNVDLPDNGKLLLGASDDLQIYHDASNSYIRDVGTGNLFIDATSLRLRTGAGTETYLTADGNGSVDLYYDNSKKFETTSTGIDVTGIVEITSNTDISMDSSASGQLYVNGNGYGFAIALDADAANIYTNSTSRDLVFGVNETEVARVKPTGIDVTGNVNATSSGGSTLTLENSITSISANELIGGIDFKGNDTSEDGNEVLAFIRAHASDTTPDSYIAFGTLQNNGGVDDVVTERMRIDNYGRLGVGTTAPTAKMHLFTDGVDQSMFSAQADLGAQNRILTLKSPVSDSTTQPFRWQTSNSILWEIDATESKSMNLNSVGNLGVGTFSPSYRIDVRGAANSDVAIQVKASGTGDVDADLRLDAADTGESIVRHMRDGATRAISEYSGSNEWNFTTYNQDVIDFQPNSTHAMRIKHNGNVGIGNTTCADKLHVEGNIYLGSSSRSVYTGGGGDLRLQANTGEIKVLTASGATTNLITSGTGINIPANLDVGGNIDLPDGSYILMGTADDLQIYHDGSNSWIREVGTGSLFIDSGTGVYLYANGNTAMLQALPGAGVTSYYNGVGKFATTSAGAEVLGNLDVDNALNVGGASPAGSGFIESTVVGSSRALQTVGSVNTTQTHIGFENLSGEIGRIDVSAFSVAYVTSSDYRLKTDIQPMQGSIDRVKALNPVNFEWVNDGGRVDGFIAHEAQEVVPEAISGERDAMRDQQYVESEATGDIYTPAVEATYETIQVELTPAVEATYDEDGNELTPAVDATYEEQQQELTPAIAEVIHSSDVVEPDELEEGQRWRETTEKVMATRQVPDYQGIDQSKLVPLLTSALQDAIAKIEALETRLEALES